MTYNPENMELSSRACLYKYNCIYLYILYFFSLKTSMVMHSLEGIMVSS